MSSLGTDLLAAVPWGVVIASSLFAASVDVRVRRIPNNLTLPLWAAGMAWGLCTSGFNGLGEALGGMAIAGLPFFLLWIIGAGGAGDAKMMFAIGAWLGIEHAFVAALCVGVAGGILSLFYATKHGRLGNSLMNTLWLILTMRFVVLGPGRLADRQKLLPPSADQPIKTPYSVAMLAGACAAATWVWLCAT